MESEQSEIVECPGDRGEVEVTCFDGTIELTGGECNSYECTCENGKPIEGSDCLQDGEYCKECNEGYEIEGDLCFWTGDCNGKEHISNGVTLIVPDIENNRNYEADCGSDYIGGLTFECEDAKFNQFGARLYSRKLP
eukprot:UN26966